MLNPERVSIILEDLKILAFYKPDQHEVVVRMVCKMATTEEQVVWLVDRMTSGLYSQWTGPHELRACFCSKFRPADGINAYSTVYPDGIESEKPQLKLQQTEMRALPEGHIASADTRSDIAMRIALAAQRQKDAMATGPATAEEIAAAPEWLRKLEGYE